MFSKVRVRQMRNRRNRSLLVSFYSLSGFIAVLFLLAGCSTPSTQYALLAIDAVLDERGITDFHQLSVASPMEIGRWLHADALVYGEVLDYEAYYGLLIAAWRVTARVRMVSTSDGHELFSCTDTRYSTNVTPAIDPVDIVINSALNILELRDITLARAEHEVGREIVLR